MPRAAHQEANVVRLKRLGIDTYQEPVVFLASSSPVCRSEGWSAQARIQVAHHNRSIIATLSVTTSNLLGPDEASLSEVAWSRLEAAEGDLVGLSYAPPVDSLGYVRGKIYGARLDSNAMTAIVRDIVAGSYSDIDLAAFVTAVAGAHADAAETTALARAMIDTGERLYWGRSPIVDKHCVGGLPDNRTSMVVTPIVAACGLTMPKTSSRAITSPAGTADAMETLAPVDLDLAHMRRVVEREGGCIVWGGRVRLAPADDIIISVERPLDLDSGTQLVASVLSKKIAAGSTHIVIDVPIGPTAKVRSNGAADALDTLFNTVANDLGAELRVIRTDGTQPVGRGIGPALEAHDVLSVLHGADDAPADLRDRAVMLAGHVLELGGLVTAGLGCSRATDVLTSGKALAKFVAICDAQGGLRTPPRAAFIHEIRATRAGRIAGIDNRRLARIAKLAGAPRAPAAGLVLHAKLGETVERDQPLVSLHAESAGELDYARAYLTTNPQVIALEDA